MKTTKQQLARIGSLALVLTGVLSPLAIAQRDAPNKQETREQRQQRIQQMTPEQRTEYFQKRIQERMANMTPEQRAQFENFRAQAQVFQRQQQVAQVSVEDRQRFLMTSAGIEDAAMQDAILAFAIELTKKREPVTKAATALRVLLGDKDATTEAITAQLEKLTKASADFRTWKEDALKELDAKVNFTENARVNSFLTLTGILGDEGSDAGGYTAIFPKDVAGKGDITDLLPKTEGNNMFGGMGGMGGGGRGGRGGKGGGQNPAPAEAPPAEAAPVN